jgi:hypothetical protein
MAMKRQRGYMFYSVMLVLIIVVTFFFDRWSCHSKWSKSGFATSWGPVQGCLIKVNDKWIPEGSYREIP